jgi:hypothetical protein
LGACRLVGKADRHHEVAIIILIFAVSLSLGRDHGRLGCRGEGETNKLGLDNAQALNEVVRVEGHGDVLTGQLCFKLFRSLRIFTGTGVEVQQALREGETNRGIALCNLAGKS